MRISKLRIDTIFCLKHITEKILALRQKIHFLFIDLRKAYDSVSHVTLWKTLLKIQIKGITIEITKKIMQKFKGKDEHS